MASSIPSGWRSPAEKSRQRPHRTGARCRGSFARAEWLGCTRGTEKCDATAGAKSGMRRNQGGGCAFSEDAQTRLQSALATRGPRRDVRLTEPCGRCHHCAGAMASVAANSDGQSARQAVCCKRAVISVTVAEPQDTITLRAAHCMVEDERRSCAIVPTLVLAAADSFVR